MRSPLAPNLANVFVCSFEDKQLKDCPLNLKPVFYRYVEDIFLLLSSLYQAEKFKKYFSSQHPNFWLEKENGGRLPFLETNIFLEKGKLVINVYWKITFSGVYTNFDSFIPETCKKRFY